MKGSGAQTVFQEEIKMKARIYKALQEKKNDRRITRRRVNMLLVSNILAA